MVCKIPIHSSIWLTFAYKVVGSIKNLSMVFDFSKETDFTNSRMTSETEFM